MKAILLERKDLEVIGTNDGFAALQIVSTSPPDLLLLDLSMPRLNGISVIKDAKRVHPDIIILVITIHESNGYVQEAFEAGVNGYCIKDTGKDEFLIAIQSVLSGKTYISPGVAANVMEGYLKGRKHLKERSLRYAPTRREREVLKLINEGYKRQEIVDILHISPKTVEKHKSKLMKKLDMHNANSPREKIDITEAI